MPVRFPYIYIPVRLPLSLIICRTFICHLYTHKIFVCLHTRKTFIVAWLLTFINYSDLFFLMIISSKIIITAISWIALIIFFETFIVFIRINRAFINVMLKFLTFSTLNIRLIFAIDVVISIFLTYFVILISFFFNNHNNDSKRVLFDTSKTLYYKYRSQIIRLIENMFNYNVFRFLINVYYYRDYIYI